MVTRLTGNAAVEYARQHDVALCKYTDPTEEHRDNLTVEEASAILSEDASLIYLDVEVANVAEQAARVIAAAGQAGGIEEVRALAERGWPENRPLERDSPELREAILVAAQAEVTP
jgi:hypothetical protein